jgi:methylated-DNA-[protein]-cysteine S-methyltransferase
MTMESDGEALTGLRMGAAKPDSGAIPYIIDDALPVFRQAAQWLDGYFGGEDAEMDVPLRLVGTPFQQAVWDLLLDIPFGEVTTYGALAERVAQSRGSRVSAQAVGGAVGRNPVLILVPCHRVIGADGSLTGYAGGLDCKRWLLEHENDVVSRQL